MSWSEWVRGSEFFDVWRDAFDEAHLMFDPGGNGIEKARAYREKDALWLEIREPLVGVRLVTAEVPLSVTPYSMALRVWTYRHATELYERLSSADRFTLDDQPQGRYVDQKPQASWQRQLDEAGVSVRGVRYTVQLESRISEGSASASEQLREIVLKFARYVLDATRTLGKSEKAVGMAQTAAAAPADATPAESGTSSLPGSDEPMAAAAHDILDVDRDPRFAAQGQPTRVALVNARIGQGGYRERMLQLWGGRCALSACDVREVLIASHARAWSDCEGVHDCLDEYNGLLLSANLDRLFDRGIISFDDEGLLLAKPGFVLNELVAWDRLRFVHDQHRPYLASHRRKHGFAE